MGKITREVKVTGEGPYMTAAEIMAACLEVPQDVQPTVDISMSGKVKAIKFKVATVPQ